MISLVPPPPPPLPLGINIESERKKESRTMFLPESFALATEHETDFRFTTRLDFRD